MNESVRPSLSRRSRITDIAARIFSATFLTLSVLALVIAGGYACNLDQYTQPSRLMTLLSLIEGLLCFLVIVGGMELYRRTLRSPASRLTFWYILLIILVAGLGLFFSFQGDSYQTACCNIVYHVGRGFPLAVLRLSYEPDTETRYSWGQVDELIAQHPAQVHQEMNWLAVVVNALFFVHAALIAIVFFRWVLSRLRATHSQKGS